MTAFFHLSVGCILLIAVALGVQEDFFHDNFNDYTLAGHLP